MDNSSRQIRVCLMGAPFDTNNRGVSALASSLVNLVTETFPDAKISFFMGNPKETNKIVNFAGKKVMVNVINYRLSPSAKLQEHLLFLMLLALLIRLLQSTQFRDKVIHWSSRLSDLDNCEYIGAINGGDSFSDIYGVGRFILGAIPLVIIILLGKRLILFPQTYGPYNSRLARIIARWIIRRSSVVLSRDLDSIPLINSLLGNSKNKVTIDFCPDVAFTLPSALPASFTIHSPADVSREGTMVGININGLLFHGGYTGANMFGLRFEYKTFIFNLVEKLMNETASTVVLIPHTYGGKDSVNSDPEAIKQVYDTLKDTFGNRLYMVTEEYKEHEIKGIIGCCDFFIGSRMHACIAAISQGVPAAAVAYSKKFSGVFECVGVEQMVVDARSLDLNEAINRIIELYQNRKLGMDSVEQKIGLAKKQVKDTFRHLFSSPGPRNEAT